MQFRYTHRGIRIARSEFAALFEDREAGRLMAAGWIPKELYQAYILEGCRYYFVCPELLEGTNEDVFRSAMALRKRFFGTAHFTEAYEAACESHRIDGIDQSDLWGRYERLPVRIFYLSEAEFVPDFLKDVQNELNDGKRIFLLAAAEEDGVLPTETILRRLLKDTGADRCVFLSVQGLQGSMDYSCVNIPEDLQKAIDAGEAVLLGYGDDALMSARNLALPAFIKVRPKGIYTRAVTGLFSLQRTSFIFVPAGFDILPYVPVIRRTELHYNLLSALQKKYGEEIYAMLQPGRTGEGVYSGPRAFTPEKPQAALDRLRKWEPELFFNIYEDHVPPIETSGFQCGSGSFEKARERFLSEKLQALPGVRTLHACFRKKEVPEAGSFLEPVPVEIDWKTEKRQHQVIVDGIICDPSLNIEFRVGGNHLISPREELFGRPENGTAILSNFAFFFTDKLRTLYNLHRTNRPDELLTEPAGYVDYYRFTDKQGVRHESFPLYRKLCLGRTSDGSFRVFSYELTGGSISFGGVFGIHFTKEDVNPAEPGEVAVYTPLISEGEPGDILRYEKEVGAGRLNLILIGEKLLTVKEGSVLMPPVGVVLSLAGTQAEAFSSFMKNAPRDVSMTLRPTPPEGFTEEEWDDLHEVYGGGLGILYEGQELTEESRFALLSRQGWTFPLSAQSQESDLVRPMKHPRTATGVTKDGRLVLLVFSGRSKVSEGADYPEMLEAARLLVPDLKALINWDGGGSSVLGLIEDEAFTEINPCAPSDDSLAGMVRPIASSILVRIPEFG